MDGLEHFPSESLFGWTGTFPILTTQQFAEYSFYIYPADWNFPADERNAIFHMYWRTGTFPADNNWRTGTFLAEMKRLVADEGICF